MKKLSAVLTLILILSLSCCSAEEVNPLTVQIRLLNGRSAPRKTASIEARFDFGDILNPTGTWSEDRKWVEVQGGETGTVWVYIPYVSERPHYSMTNERYRRIKVRKWPVIGKVTGYIFKGRTVEIEQTIMGWGKTKKGWVDLSYLVEYD